VSHTVAGRLTSWLAHTETGLGAYGSGARRDGLPYQVSLRVRDCITKALVVVQKQVDTGQT
jgi:hypothetical protein